MRPADVGCGGADGGAVASSAALMTDGAKMFPPNLPEPSGLPPFPSAVTSAALLDEDCLPGCEFASPAEKEVIEACVACTAGVRLGRGGSVRGVGAGGGLLPKGS